jgi:hypothetical protein
VFWAIDVLWDGEVTRRARVIEDVDCADEDAFKAVDGELGFELSLEVFLLAESELLPPADVLTAFVAFAAGSALPFTRRELS